MGKNFDVVVPFDALVVPGKILITANPSYSGGGTVVDFSPINKLARLYKIVFQSRGTNPATNIRLNIVDNVGAISPLCRDIIVPATTANDLIPLWSRTMYFPGSLIQSGAFLRASTTKDTPAGIAVTPWWHIMETP